MHRDWKLVVFTDLDGTLLDRATFRFDAAMPALERLRKLGASVVLVSSKTQEEVEAWRQELQNLDPFAVENGGAVFAEHGKPHLRGSAVRVTDRYEVVEFGVPYREIVWALADGRYR